MSKENKENEIYIKSNRGVGRKIRYLPGQPTVPGFRKVGPFPRTVLKKQALQDDVASGDITVIDPLDESGGRPRSTPARPNKKQVVKKADPKKEEVDNFKAETEQPESKEEVDLSKYESEAKKVYSQLKNSGQNVEVALERIRNLNPNLGKAIDLVIAEDVEKDKEEESPVDIRKATSEAVATDIAKDSAKKDTDKILSAVDIEPKKKRGRPAKKAATKKTSKKKTTTKKTATKKTATKKVVSEETPKSKNDDVSLDDL